MSVHDVLGRTSLQMILIRICVMDNVAMSLSLSLKKQIDPVMVTSVAVVGNPHLQA